MTGEIHKLEPTPPQKSQGGSGSGGGKDLSDRVSKLEAHMAHAATKADIEELKGSIIETKLSLQRWVLGGVVAAMLFGLLIGSRFIPALVAGG